MSVRDLLVVMTAKMCMMCRYFGRTCSGEVSFWRSNISASDLRVVKNLP